MTTRWNYFYSITVSELYTLVISRPLYESNNKLNTMCLLLLLPTITIITKIQRMILLEMSLYQCRIVCQINVTGVKVFVLFLSVWTFSYCRVS